MHFTLALILLNSVLIATDAGILQQHLNDADEDGSRPPVIVDIVDESNWFDSMMKPATPKATCPYPNTSPTLPVRYMKVAVVVESNIYKLHFQSNAQANVKNIQDLFYSVNNIFSDLNVIVSIAGIILWTQNNLFEITDLDALRGYSSQYKSVFNHDHMVALRSGTYESSNSNGAAGLAYVDAMCSDYSLSWATVYTDPNLFYKSAAYIGHEINHSVGFTHEDMDCLCNGVQSISEVPVNTKPLVYTDCARSQFADKAPSYTCMLNKPRIFRVQSVMNNKVLDVYTSNTAAGARVVMWDANFSDAQLWYIGGDMAIRSYLNDFCLTSNGNPSIVTMERCDDGRRDNKWVYNNWTGEIQIATDSSRCLGITNNDNNLGAVLSEYTCQGISSQLWNNLDKSSDAEISSNIFLVG